MLGIGLGLQKRSGTIEFSPDQVSNLELWLESDMGVYTLNGSNVAAWADQSGNGNHAVQATAVNQPAYVTNQLNSLPVIRFNRNNLHFLQTVSPIGISGSQDRTIIIINKPEITANILQWSFGFGDPNSNPTPYRFFGGMTLDTTWTTAGFAGFNYGANSHVNAYNILCYMFPQASTLCSNLLVYRNGTSLPVTTRTGTDGTINTLNTVFDIGRAGPSNLFGGDIAAILVYSKALSTQERQSVEQYLSNKYDIALS